MRFHLKKQIRKLVVKAALLQRMMKYLLLIQMEIGYYVMVNGLDVMKLEHIFIGIQKPDNYLDLVEKFLMIIIIIQNKH